MIYFSIILAGLLVGMPLLHLANRLGRVVEVMEENTGAIDKLRLTSRTRIRDVKVQSGEVTNEQQLVRLGRASAGRRIVFGGDDDSLLNQQLKRGVAGGDDDE